MSFGTKYLHYPDLFPARRSGEAWGKYGATIDLIGGPYRVSGLSERQLERVEESYGELIPARGVRGRIELQVFRSADSDFLPLQEVPATYQVDLDPSAASLRLACHEFMARLDWVPQLTACLWTSFEDGEDFDRVFANYFRTAVAYAVLESGGALVHSAGLLDDQGAMLFVGHSGAGKSTITRLGHHEGLQVLSDDLNALCLEDGKLRLERLPFAGEFRTEGPYGRYPLSSVFRLNKGEQFSIQPIGQAEALAFVASCCPFVNSDPYRAATLLENLDRLIDRFPVQDLTFPLAGGFWDRLRSVRAA